MFKSIKSILLVIPCMIFCAFLFSNSSVSAVDAELINGNKIVIGDEQKENVYYFTNDRSWEFKANYNAVKDWDTYVTYTVIKPDGSSTKESKKYNYVNNGGKFSINDINSLEYTENMDISTRNSVVPGATYYVDIKYYAGFMGIPVHQNKDETIKIVLGNSDEGLNVPKVQLNYDSAKNKFNIVASIIHEDKGISVIEKIMYYFSKDSIENTKNTFLENAGDSGVSVLEFSPSSSVSADFDGSKENGNRYVYVLVVTANGYSELVKFDMQSNQSEKQESNNPPTSTGGSNNSGNGFLDYELSQLILLVLVVILIVSCALIITQKIIDYRKRLY